MTLETLLALLDRIDIAGPFADWRFGFDAEPSGNGFLIWANIWRRDRDTGAFGWGMSRKEYIAADASESAVFKTAWVVTELTVRHEIMEAFRVDAIIVFDPHRTIAELQSIGLTP